MAGRKRRVASGKLRVSIRREIFFSHSGENDAFAQALAARLRSADLKIWYFERHIRAAAEWNHEIGKALERCNWFLLLISPAALKSHWVYQEYTYAQSEKRFRGRIVPLIYQTAKLDARWWTLKNLQSIDCRGNLDTAVAQLTNLWRLKAN